MKKKFTKQQENQIHNKKIKTMKTTIKTTILIAILAIFVQHASYGQIQYKKTGTLSAPSRGTSLELLDNNLGLLPNVVALVSNTDVTTITKPPTAVLVYNPGTGGLTPAGFYYNAGDSITANWLLFSTNKTGWNTTGNSGTTAGTNYIGTTDAQNVFIKRNTGSTSADYLVLTNAGLGVSASSPTDNTNSGKTIFFGQTGNITGTSGLDVGIDNDNNSTASKFRVIKDAATNILAIAEVGTIGLGSSENVGTSGQVITSAGVGAAVTWAAPISKTRILLTNYATPIASTRYYYSNDLYIGSLTAAPTTITQGLAPSIGNYVASTTGETVTKLTGWAYSTTASTTYTLNLSLYKYSPTSGATYSGALTGTLVGSVAVSVTNGNQTSFTFSITTANATLNANDILIMYMQTSGTTTNTFLYNATLEVTVP